MELVNPKIQFVVICLLLLSRVAIAGDDDHQEDDETSPDQHRQLESVPDIKTMSQNTNSPQVSVGSQTPQQQQTTSDSPSVPVVKKRRHRNKRNKKGGRRRKRGGHGRKKRKFAGFLPKVASQSPQKTSQSPPSVSQSPPQSSNPPPQPQVSQSPPEESSKSPPPPQVSQAVSTPENELHKPLPEGVTHKQAFLEEHNKIRDKIGQPLYQWNETLYKWAQNWANHRMEDCKMEHSGGPYGENLFWGGKSHWTAIDVVRSWGDESEFWDPKGNTCQSNQPCGHYTQIVWKDSKQVGCAIVECKNNQGIFAICNYDPPGNFRTEHPFDDNIAKYQERLRTGKRP